MHKNQNMPEKWISLQNLQEQKDFKYKIVVWKNLKNEQADKLSIWSRKNVVHKIWFSF